MKKYMSTRASQAGDTIVEVMFALAVLGSVLGSAYVVVNRSIITNRLSQERHEAVKLAESQFEKLQVKAALDPTLLQQNGAFCLDASNTVRNIPHADCRVDATGNPTANDPTYRISIVRDAFINLPSSPGVQIGTRFKISIAWSNARGSGDDALDYFYEVYK